MQKRNGPSLCRFAFFLTLLWPFFSFANNETITRSLKICGDGVDWPPYTYLMDGKAAGYDADTIAALFTPLGIKYQIELTSWTRCLKATKEGTVDIALSASYNAIRARYYHYTHAYYAITPVYIFAPQNHAKEPEIIQAKDIDKFQTCGIYGYSYSTFGIDTGLIKQVDVSLHKALQALQQKDCDLVLIWKEVLAGFKHVWDIDYLNDRFQTRDVPGVTPTPMHFLVSKKLSDGEMIRDLINRRLYELETNGKLEQLRQKHRF